MELNGSKDHLSVELSLSDDFLDKVDEVNSETRREATEYYWKFPNFLGNDICRAIGSLDLGPDPTSNFFARRTKNIRFVMVYSGHILLLCRNKFKQPDDYNDFSGGYWRTFDLIPDEVCKMLSPVVLKFVSHFEIPDKTILLMQLQSSDFTCLEKKSSEKKSSNGRLSVTGQGIHSDGHQHAALICIHRGFNISGAVNGFYWDLNGVESVAECILQPGDMVLWRDDCIYHHVTRVETKDRFRTACNICYKRTMLLVHSPADFVFFGEENDVNKLGRRDSAIKLRRSLLNSEFPVAEDTDKVE